MEGKAEIFINVAGKQDLCLVCFSYTTSKGYLEQEGANEDIGRLEKGKPLRSAIEQLEISWIHAGLSALVPVCKSLTSLL